MTGEEIVEGLKLLEDNMVHFDELQNDKGEWIDVHELLFEAIQALEQQSCDDAISRQAVLYGKWQVVSDGYGDSAYICECSECKDTVWVYKDADRKWNYCPSCGAKMQESEVRNEV